MKKKKGNMTVHMQATASYHLQSYTPNCALVLKSAILVYVILNGKGFLTGCGQHVYTLASFAIFYFYKTFLFLHICIIILHVRSIKRSHY